jgi:DNA polymerase (family 10)
MEQHFISLLKDTAILLELASENPFKANAFKNAARLLETLPPLEIESATISNMQHDQLQETIRRYTAGHSGLGKGIQDAMLEYLTTGSMQLYDELRATIPEGVFAMTTLRGLGAKKVRTLWKELGITSPDELLTACQEQRVASLKGFGAKTQANILEALEQWRSAQSQLLLHTALEYAKDLLAVLRSCAAVERAEFTGEVRRYCETVRSLDFVLQAKHDVDIAINELQAHTGAVLNLQLTRSQPTTALSSARSVYSAPAYIIPSAMRYAFLQGTYTAQNRMSSAHRVRVTLFITDKNSFEALWEYTTATPEYTTAVIQHRAQKSSRIHPTQTLAVPIPPELRDALGEELFDTATQESLWSGTLLHDLIETSHIKGMLHVHSTWSDGKHSIRQMALAAQALGCSYIAICDHSKSAFYANGLSEERIKRQHEEIDQLNEQLRQEFPDAPKHIRVLKGIESDILADGSLDYSDAILETFDLVVASVHSQFTMSREAMTERIVRAMEHPCTHILGHPTGRLLLTRKGYEVELDRVIEAAARTGTALELNANPHRLDLSWRSLIAALRHNVTIAINTDAHNTDNMRFIELGVRIARKAALTRERCINTLPVDAFLHWTHTGTIEYNQSDS